MLLSVGKSDSGNEMFTRVMVGIDGSLTAVAALTEAIQLATAEKAAIRAVSVVERVPDIVVRALASSTRQRSHNRFATLPRRRSSGRTIFSY